MDIAQRTYERRVNEQIAQYRDKENMYADLANIHSYAQKKYVSPKLLAICNAENHLQFYAKEMVRRLKQTGANRILSLGSGAGQVEIGIAQTMRKLGVDDFAFACVELSEPQITRARRNTEDQGISDRFEFIQADLNTWNASQNEYACVMCHHALHHVQDLEHLLTQIMTALHPDGAFITMDVIGRNGHMRWPETLAIVEHIWQFIPDEKKVQRVLKTMDIQFVNRDCSVRGFEGIRAQDILPQLIAQGFGFEKFLAWGGLTEVFTMHYGGNYDSNNEKDRAFIDFIHYLNELLIDLGYIKPTIMAAVAVLDPDVRPRVYKHWTPEFCIRVPDDGIPAISVSAN